MKVLVFTSLYPNNISPNHGVFIKERVTHFAKLDRCEIKVVAPVPYFPAIKINWRWSFSQVVPVEIRDGIEVYHPRYYIIPKIGMSLYGLLMFLSVLRTIRKIIKNFDFDLIDAHFVYPDGMAAVLLGRFFGKPVVVSARGSDINRYAKFPIICRFLKYTLKRADAVTAVSQALKKVMVELGIPEAHIHVIPNGVSTDKFYPLPKKQARKSLGLPVEARVILSVGHLTVNKGFDVIIKSLKILFEKTSEKNFYLVIVGDGTAKTELKKLVSCLRLDDHVFFAGAIPHEELYRWHSAADVFCLASSQEGWPNVLLEALACGTPVVATAVGGIPEIIRSQKVGLLTERETAKFAETLWLALNKQWQSDDVLRYAQQHTWQQAVFAMRCVAEAIINGKN